MIRFLSEKISTNEAVENVSFAFQFCRNVVFNFFYVSYKLVHVLIFFKGLFFYNFGECRRLSFSFDVDSLHDQLCRGRLQQFCDIVNGDQGSEYQCDYWMSDDVQSSDEYDHG